MSLETFDSNTVRIHVFYLCSITFLYFDNSFIYVCMYLCNQECLCLRYHPCCTCPMGNSKDVRRVTDANLRVVGIQNLRVIDGSSFPRIPSVNMNAPINLVGEIGSYLICKQWTGKPCK